MCLIKLLIKIEYFEAVALDISKTSDRVCQAGLLINLNLMDFPVDIVCSFLSKRQLQAVLHRKGLYMSALLMLMFLKVSVLVLLFLHCTSMLFLIILPITMLMMLLFTESLIQLLNLNIK